MKITLENELHPELNVIRSETVNKIHEVSNSVAKDIEAENAISAQICYKTNKPCKHDCQGLCRDSF